MCALPALLLFYPCCSPLPATVPYCPQLPPAVLRSAQLNPALLYCSCRFVQHCLVGEGTVSADGIMVNQGIVPWLRKQGFSPAFLNIWTDGCSEQFK